MNSVKKSISSTAKSSQAETSHMKQCAVFHKLIPLRPSQAPPSCYYFFQVNRQYSTSMNQSENMYSTNINSAVVSNVLSAKNTRFTHWQSYSAHSFRFQMRHKVPHVWMYSSLGSSSTATTDRHFTPRWRRSLVFHHRWFQRQMRRGKHIEPARETCQRGKSYPNFKVWVMEGGSTKGAQCSKGQWKYETLIWEGNNKFSQIFPTKWILSAFHTTYSSIWMFFKNWLLLNTESALFNYQNNFSFLTNGGPDFDVFHRTQWGGGEGHDTCASLPPPFPAFLIGLKSYFALGCSFHHSAMH